jgi:tetratricopeptide (TPR) repeat protein
MIMRYWNPNIMRPSRFRILVVCLAITALGAAQASPPARLAAIQQDLFSPTPHVDDAIRELRSILATDPKSPEAHLLLGVAYRGKGGQELVSEAVAEFRQAIDLSPTLVPARLYLAYTYRDLGRLDAAKKELDTALEQLPGNPQLLAVLGDTERQLKNRMRALEVLRQALKADESFAQARYYLGLTYWDLDRRDEAIAELEQVVKSGAKVADAYLSLGGAYIEAERIPDAVEILSQGTHIDPARPDLRIQLAKALRLNGALAKSEEQLKIANPERASTLLDTQRNQFDLQLEMGLLKLAQRQYDAAARALKRCLSADPNHGPANRGMAEVYLAQGSYTLARDHAVRAEKAGFPLPDDKQKLLIEKLRAKGSSPR